MQPQSLHLDLIPLDLAWADPAENLRRMREAVHDRLRTRKGIRPEERLFVFPEVTLTAFVTEKESLTAFDRGGSEVEEVRQLAREAGVAIAFGFPERAPGDKPLNTLLVISPEGRDLAVYHKQHLFTHGQNPESATFGRGERGTLFTYRGWRIGLGICFDLRFPAMFQAYARAGADLLLLPACWVGGAGKSYQFRTLAAARAIECQAFFAALNRRGADPHFQYEGEALAYGPRGEPLLANDGFDLDPGLLISARALEVRASDLDAYPLHEG